MDLSVQATPPPALPCRMDSTFICGLQALGHQETNSHVMPQVCLSNSSGFLSECSERDRDRESGTCLRGPWWGHS